MGYYSQGQIQPGAGGPPPPPLQAGNPWMGAGAKAGKGKPTGSPQMPMPQMPTGGPPPPPPGMPASSSSSLSSSAQKALSPKSKPSSPKQHASAIANQFAVNDPDALLEGGKKKSTGSNPYDIADALDNDYKPSATMSRAPDPHSRQAHRDPLPSASRSPSRPPAAAAAQAAPVERVAVGLPNEESVEESLEKEESIDENDI